MKNINKMTEFDYYCNLFKEMEERHRKKPTIYDKIIFELKEFEKTNIFKYIKNDPKSKKNSVEYRNQGNKYFSLKAINYWLALQLYNKSICYAEPKSENLSLGYGNRSAVYYELKEYEKCLENINLARSSSRLSSNLQKKLNKREHNCLIKLNQSKTDLNEKNDDDFVPQLSYPPHHNVQYIANCLEIKENNEFGRLIVTNQDLEVGDCIAVEPPLKIKTLDTTFAYSRCAYCLQENTLSLIPCNNCTETMFCNNDCYEKGFELFHKFECTSQNVLKTLTLIERSALRVVLGLFSDIEELKKIKKVRMKNNCENFNVFKYECIKKNYKLIHGLESNESKRSENDLNETIAVVAMLYATIKENQYLKKIITNSSYEKIFLELLYLQLQAAEINYSSLNVQVPEKNSKYLKHLQTGSNKVVFLGFQNDLHLYRYAVGIYPIFSILNHSCSPNVINIEGNNNYRYLYVTRKISKGEQLFESYGPNHNFMSKFDRQAILKSTFIFDCKCEACQFNYPIFRQLKSKLDLPYLYTNEIFTNLKSNDKNFAKTVLIDSINYLRTNDKFYPAAQVVHALKCLHLCLQILLTPSNMAQL